MLYKILVSGCYDILHAGHIQFFEDARALGNYLVVSIASDASLWKHKHRKPSIPLEHKISVLRALKMVDEVVVGDNLEVDGLDFIDNLSGVRTLVVTEDDRYAEVKKELCAKHNIIYKSLLKGSKIAPVSTTSLLRNIIGVKSCPARVDFAGGWADDPHNGIDGYVVNCSISPLVSIDNNPYGQCTGIGGSAIEIFLNSEDSVASELAKGVGWQDPVVISETGLCVWKTGGDPKLVVKYYPIFLEGLMALLWTQGRTERASDISVKKRPFGLIQIAGSLAANAVKNEDYSDLCDAVRISYDAQLAEGMEMLPEHKAVAKKYCGAGWGGWALYLFDNFASRDQFVEEGGVAIEPYMRWQ